MPSFCAACGAGIAPEDALCPACGKHPLAAPGPVSPTLPPNFTPQTSGKAIASLVFGILFFIPFAFLAAVIFGHLGLSEIRKSAGRLKGEDIARAGLILGYVWFAAVSIVLIIAAIAIPNLLRAKRAANEASAVASIRRIITAEIAHSVAKPKVGFTCSMSDLRDWVDPSIASGQKYGYKLEVLDCQTNADGAVDRYHIVAWPVQPNVSGSRAFCTDESAVISQDASGSTKQCIEKGVPLQ